MRCIQNFPVCKSSYLRQFFRRGHPSLFGSYPSLPQHLHFCTAPRGIRNNDASSKDYSLHASQGRLHSTPQTSNAPGPLPCSATSAQRGPQETGFIQPSLWLGVGHQQPWAKSRALGADCIWLAGSLGIDLTPIPREQVPLRNFSITWCDKRSNLEQKRKRSSHKQLRVVHLEEANPDLPFREQRW